MRSEGRVRRSNVAGGVVPTAGESQQGQERFGVHYSSPGGAEAAEDAPSPEWHASPLPQAPPPTLRGRRKNSSHKQREKTAFCFIARKHCVYYTSLVTKRARLPW